ncbi:MAG: DUF1080 domain-containing protein, partial [Planctomycetota bacterium]
NHLFLSVISILAFVKPAMADVQFRKYVIDPQFKAESCAVGDINRDGRADIIAGENWYEAPGWRPHKFRSMVFMKGYADTRCDYAVDINGDGWVDIVTVRRRSDMEWLENPKGKEQEWARHLIGKSTLTEGIIYEEVDGDGRKDFVGPIDKKGRAIAWWKAPDKKVTEPWLMTRVGPKGEDRHGIAVGDVNRDGRNDILSRIGWYQAPQDPTTPDWKFHAVDRGVIHHQVVYDFDSDGDQDIASSSPHHYGLFWWEQQTVNEQTTWKQHVIDKSISQMHDLVPADIDGDGDDDLVSGKRYYAHLGKDPGADEPAKLMWYELKREKGVVTFIPHQIDDDSGIGYIVTPADVDGDGDMDIVSANKKGVFLFEQIGKPQWLELFNGKDLSNWVGDKSPWSVVDGMIVGKTETGLKRNNFLASTESYDNFVLTLDVKLVPDKGNSGIQFRSKRLGDYKVQGYQATIGTGAGGWGSIYEEHGRALLYDGYKNLGEKAVIKNAWNHYVVYAVGEELRVEINGTVCTDLHDGKSKSGVIALQIHRRRPMDIKFKNIKLRKVEN